MCQPNIIFQYQVYTYISCDFTLHDHPILNPTQHLHVPIVFSKRHDMAIQPSFFLRRFAGAGFGFRLGRGAAFFFAYAAHVA